MAQIAEKLLKLFYFIKYSSLFHLFLFQAQHRHIVSPGRDCIPISGQDVFKRNRDLIDNHVVCHIVLCILLTQEYDGSLSTEFREIRLMAIVTQLVKRQNQ